MSPKNFGFWILLAAVGVSLSAESAFAQRGWVGPGGGNNAASGGAQSGNAGGQGGGKAAHAGGSHQAPSGFRSQFGGRPVGSITDPGFAGRLGRTVSGFGNINTPAGQPGIQPLPTGSGFPIPNINFPGGAVETHRRRGQGHGNGGHFQHGFSGFGGFYTGGYTGSVLYAVPYYVPVYTEVVPAPPAYPEQPRPYDIREYRGAAPSPAQPQEFTSRPQARPITLLAFKDSTVIAVTDYWMQGYSLVYETSLGVRTVIPLDQLDWALTQQLNFERNVPFVLEARP